MNDLESKLRSALRRKEAPADFAGKVMAQLKPSRTSRPEGAFAFLRLRTVRWVAAGACACLLIALFIYDRRQERTRAEGELARAQAITALRIASAELNSTLAKVINSKRTAPPQER
jgi:hypothetical protein